MREIIQTAAIALCLIGLASGAYLVITFLGSWAFRRWDEHQISSHSHAVEREAKRKEEAMRRYSMTDMRGTRAP